jgi:hypothetical protein
MADLSMIMAAILAASSIASAAAVYVAHWHGSALHRAGEAPTHLFTTKKAKP